MNNSTGGASFLYHYDDNKVAVGFVLHLNYPDPYLSPFDEFQRFKTHPSICTVFEGGKRLAYGARATTEGGYQSVPRLTSAGGALIGCAAGFVNVPRIKGVHNAMGSGMLAAKHVAAALGAGCANDELAEYENAWRDSAVGKDLHGVRNVQPLWSKFGTTDGKISFDKLSSVFLSNTNHEEDQPVHLKVRRHESAEAVRARCLCRPLQPLLSGRRLRMDRGGVKSALPDQRPELRPLQTCDVKDPNGNITWVPPEGGGGPNYEAM